jgi:hypothetical protein
MKKILLIILTIVVVLIIGIFIINKIEDAVIKEDNKYIKTLLDKDIKPSMTPDELKAYCEKHKRHLGLWDCPETSKKNNECIGERVLVVTFPLPSDFFLLGKGDAQIYFYVSSENKLESFDYELYYPRFH